MYDLDGTTETDLSACGRRQAANVLSDPEEGPLGHSQTWVIELFGATLENAITLYQYYKGRPDKKSQRLLAEEVDWLMSPDDTYLFSFLSVCAALRTNPHDCRATILALPGRRVKTRGPTRGPARRLYTGARRAA